MEKLDNIKGAIFDLDGTLLDSMRVWEDVDRLFLRKRGIEVPEDYIEKLNPMSFTDAANYTIERFCLNDTAENLIKEWHTMTAYRYAHEIKLKPYAGEYLKQLKKRGVLLGVATALEKELFMPCLRLNGIDGFFDACSSVSEVKRGKGFPDVYLSVSQKLGLNPCECAVFEDIYAGIAGANHGGFITVGVYEPYSQFESEKIKKAATLYINSFAELLD